MKQVVRRTLALSVVSAVSAGLLSVARPAVFAREQDPDARARVAEARALVRVVYAGLRGRLVPGERPFRWSNDFFKGQSGTTYVPFTLTIDRATISAARVAVYVLATPHLDLTPNPGGAARDNSAPERLQNPPPPAVVFEGVFFVDLNSDEAGDARRVRRAFSLPPGDYDVYVALAASRETGAGTRPEPKDPKDEDAKVMLIKQEVSVPNLWTNELATSTVVVAERVEPLAAPPAPDEQTSDPYALDAVRIVPAGRADFQRTEQPAVIFFVYNAGLTSERKPDVTVEYLLYRRGPDGETSFSRTNRQSFNAQTLDGFDVDAGHQLVGGQTMLLSEFPQGAYRLEIKVTDNTRGATVIRNVDFAVR